MKALLYSFMVVALVGGMVGGGLFAYFSDTETSVGNTFVAGTIDITAVVDPAGMDYENGLDAKPCEAAYLDVTITNIGANDVDVWKKIDITSDSLEVLAGVTYFDLTVDGVEIIADGVVLLSAINGMWISLGPLTAGGTMNVEQSFHIMDSAGNEYQGDTIIFDETFEAQQTSNPNPPAGTVYP